MTANKETKTFLTYKGKPMIRRGNKIYYGSFDEKYIIEFTIDSTRKVGNLEISKEVTIALKDTGRMDKDAVKTAHREGLYKAIDIAEFWLRDALGEV